jgi:hypothetical protein
LGSLAFATAITVTAQLAEGFSSPFVAPARGRAGRTAASDFAQNCGVLSRRASAHGVAGIGSTRRDRVASFAANRRSAPAWSALFCSASQGATGESAAHCPFRTDGATRSPPQGDCSPPKEESVLTRFVLTPTAAVDEQQIRPGVGQRSSARHGERQDGLRERACVPRPAGGLATLPRFAGRIGSSDVAFRGIKPDPAAAIQAVTGSGLYDGWAEWITHSKSGANAHHLRRCGPPAMPLQPAIASRTLPGPCSGESADEAEGKGG